jgi:hypothetical protein
MYIQTVSFFLISALRGIAPLLKSTVPPISNLGVITAPICALKVLCHEMDWRFVEQIFVNAMMLLFQFFCIYFAVGDLLYSRLIRLPACSS